MACGVSWSPCHPVILSSCLVLLCWLAPSHCCRCRSLLLSLSCAAGTVRCPVDPVFGLYWAILSVPVQESRASCPAASSYTQAAMLLAVVRLGGLTRAGAPRAPLSGWSPVPALVAFLWALLLRRRSTPYSRAEVFKETVRWFEAFLIWLIAVTLARRPWQIVGLIACLLLAPAAEAAIGLTQFVTG